MRMVISNVNMLYKNKYLCGFIKTKVVLLSYTVHGPLTHHSDSSKASENKEFIPLCKKKCKIKTRYVLTSIFQNVIKFPVLPMDTSLGGSSLLIQGQLHGSNELWRHQMF